MSMRVSTTSFISSRILLSAQDVSQGSSHNSSGDMVYEVSSESENQIASLMSKRESKQNSTSSTNSQKN